VVENNHNNEMHVSVVVKGGAAHQSGIQEVLPCPRLRSLDFALQELNQTKALNTGAPVLCVCTCERAASSRERRLCVYLLSQGDVILKVNEHIIHRRMGVETVTGHIRGPIGSVVTMRMRKADGFSLRINEQSAARLRHRTSLCLRCLASGFC
jgi:hypothetical protein